MRSLRWTLLLLLIAWPGAMLQAAPAPRLFPETGWRVAGRLLAFWESGGGLQVFGLPLGPARADANGGQVQLFERARLELHSQNAPPYDLQLGRLGADLLARRARDWHAEPDSSVLPGTCSDFAATGRSVCGPFLDYWRAHGRDLGDAGVSWRESLALFGLPLTAAQIETSPTGKRLIMQWFERARFEYHPANPAPYQVLLGRLGAELSGEPPPLPRPTLRLAPRTAVLQGHTLQVDARIDGATEMHGTLGGVSLAFTRTPAGWTALGGVSALQRPGPLLLAVEAALPDGRASLATATLTVQDARYPVERIDLPPSVEQALANNQEALAAERAQVNAIWPVVTPDRLWQGRFNMPAAGEIRSVFGVGRAYDGGAVNSFHEGVDIANRAGTPIVAPARGRVVLVAADFVARGGAVILDHGWGVHSGYWHMEQVLAREGQLVEAGEVIGLMGTRGMSTAPHLHWELRIGAISVDPLEWTAREWPD